MDLRSAALSLETAWRAGRLGRGAGPQSLLFGRMHEDVEIEREAFLNRGRVFCIASAGSTAIALSREHEVVACDINPIQLAYAKRRVLGGAAEVGDAERAMAFARAFAPLVGWTNGKVRDFLALTNIDEQAGFWRRYLDTWRFRMGLDLAMSPAILRLVYSPQLLACLPPKFGGVLRGRLERCLTTHPNATNPYAKALLAGDEAEAQISPNVANIGFASGDAASYLESCPEGWFDAFTLSNILDGAEPSYGERLWRAVRWAGTADAVVVLRSFGEPGPGLKSNLAARDRSMLWGVVEVRRARE